MIPSYTTWNSRRHNFYCWIFFMLCKFLLHIFCWVLFCVFWAWILVCCLVSCIFWVWIWCTIRSIFMLCVVCAVTMMVVGINIWVHDQLNVSSLAICPCYMHWIVERLKIIKFFENCHQGYLCFFYLWIHFLPLLFLISNIFNSNFLTNIPS